jgi:hypothetical protein
MMKMQRCDDGDDVQASNDQSGDDEMIRVVISLFNFLVLVKQNQRFLPDTDPILHDAKWSYAQQKFRRFSKWNTI